MKGKGNLGPFILFIGLVNFYIGLKITLLERGDMPQENEGNIINIQMAPLNISNNMSNFLTARINFTHDLDNKSLSKQYQPIPKQTVLDSRDRFDLKTSRVQSVYLQTLAVDVLNKPPPEFVKGLQSHCFLMDTQATHNHGKASADVTNKGRPQKTKSQRKVGLRNYLIGDQPSFAGLPSLHAEDLRCLPPFYFIGFTKCGTTEFYGHFIQHQHVIAPVFKEPRFWDENRPPSEHKRSLDYMTQNHETMAAIIEKCYLGNDTSFCHGNFPSRNWDLDIQLNLDTLYKELQQYKNQGRPCPLVSVDASTTYVSNSYMSDGDPHNKGSLAPKVLPLHRIHHLQPQAKIVVLLRDPVTRLYSDFNFFIRPKTKGPELFHKVVTGGIAWWKECTQKYSNITCAYSFQPPGMPPLPEGMFGWGEKSKDKYNGAGRLRQGFYSLFISKWYEVYPKDQILVLKFEDISANSVDVLKSQVFPFLDMAPLSQSGEMRIKDLQKRGHLNKLKGSRARMLPETENILRDFYRPFNKELVKLLGDKFTW